MSLTPGCEVIPDVNVNKEKFNIKIKLKESDDIEICCSSVSGPYVLLVTLFNCLHANTHTVNKTSDHEHC